MKLSNAHTDRRLCATLQQKVPTWSCSIFLFFFRWTHSFKSGLDNESSKLLPGTVPHNFHDTVADLEEGAGNSSDNFPPITWPSASPNFSRQDHICSTLEFQWGEFPFPLLGWSKRKHVKWNIWFKKSRVVIFQRCFRFFSGYLDHPRYRIRG